MHLENYRTKGCRLFIGFVAVLGVVLLSGCANRGVGPQGGPKDSLPPVVVKEKPENGTLNFNSKKAEIFFDEYIQLTNIPSNVVMSPPQLHPPVIRALGKKILISFEDSLAANTTYTIDFGAAIVDNNERIPLNGYTYSFATGDHIDTLGIFGQVINAENLNPVSELTVGIYEDLADSAFETKPFMRIAKTDSLGYFGIRNVHPGRYRVYALNDKSRDYRYQIGEGLAYNNEVFEPYIRTEMAEDSSIAFYYEPADVLLWYFTEKRKSQYFTRATHPEPHQLILTFGAPQDSFPTINALNDSINWAEHLLLQHSKGKDTLVYWINDSIAMLDTLRFTLTYQKTDSAYNLYWQTDTLRAVYTAPRLNARTQAKVNEQKRNKAIVIKSNAKNTFEVYDTLRLSVDAPLKSFETSAIHLSQKIDTTFKEVPIRLSQGDSIGMSYRVLAQLNAGESYLLEIDSGAMHDIYGHSNQAFKASIKLKQMEDYASVKINVLGTGQGLRMQLINTKDQVVRELPVVNGAVTFRYLPAGACYLRLYEDLNGDGCWTTGDWSKKRAPEPVYYFPAKLNLRANWDFEETFDYQATDQLDSKPYEITKTQKPTE